MNGDLEKCIHQHPLLPPTAMAESRRLAAEAPPLTKRQIAELLPLLDDPEQQRRRYEDLTTQLTVSEVAVVIGASTAETRKLIRDGLLNSTGAGSRTRIAHYSVDQYLHSLDTICEECGGRRAFRRREKSRMCVTDSELADPEGRRPEWLPKPRKTTKRPTSG